MVDPLFSESVILVALTGGPPRLIGLQTGLRHFIAIAAVNPSNFTRAPDHSLRNFPFSLISSMNLSATNHFTNPHLPQTRMSNFAGRKNCPAPGRRFGP
jgi:hypothetical protein